MTLQDTRISQILLENSRITGVNIQTLNTNLSDIAHGLYIESISKDRYIDLRLSCERAFWGHSHPLLVQHQFSNLTFGPTDLKLIKPEDFYKEITNYQSTQVSEISELIGAKISDKKLYLKLDESILFSDINEVFDNLKNLSDSNDLLIEENDLLLLANRDLFNTKDIKCRKFIKVSFIKEYITYNEEESYSEEAANLPLLYAMEQFLKQLIYPENGKLDVDNKIFTPFLKNHPQITCKGSYLLIPTIINQQKFLEHGIYISEKNYLQNNTILAFPLSCTNEELSDTLDRISKIILE